VDNTNLELAVQDLQTVAFEAKELAVQDLKAASGAVSGIKAGSA